jgi:hypothetical protein
LGVFSVRGRSLRCSSMHSSQTRLVCFYQSLIGNTDPDDRPGTHWVALCIDANSRGEYYDPTGWPPFVWAYVNFMNIHCVYLFFS